VFGKLLPPIKIALFLGRLAAGGMLK